MAARHLRQYVYTTTKAHLRLTLMVSETEYTPLSLYSTVQILWLFRIPMAVSLALTRCAITIFFIRTLFTRGFPWLRRIGSRICIPSS
jgi:hypothetical protein